MGYEQPRSAAKTNTGGLILLYHRVADLASDPQRLAITPAHFSEHLEVLRREAHVLPLREMVRLARDGRLPPRSVAVTFDDGYADNLHEALPKLEHFGVPATVFVASGYVGGAREFWWDELERLFLTGAFKNGDRHEHNDVAMTAAYHERCITLRSMTSAQRDAALAAVWSASAGRHSPAPPRPTHRPLTHAELRMLAGNHHSNHDSGPDARASLIEIGAHTVWHPSLSALPPADQQREIALSKQQLEEWLERPVTAFSYPFGTRADCSADTARLVQQAGFCCGCANVRGRVRFAQKMFELPRWIVRDGDGDSLARLLHEAWNAPAAKGVG